MQGIGQDFGQALGQPALGQLCVSDACIHAASEVLWTLSPDYKNIDPCTNFEAMTCDGWKERHELGATDTRISRFSTLNDDAYRIVRRIMEEGYPGNSNHSHFSPQRLAKREVDLDQENYSLLIDMYDACMNKTAIDHAGIDPFMDILEDLMKLLPKDGETSDKAFVGDASLWFFKHGWSTLVSVGPGMDDMNPDTMVLNVFPPRGITLPANQYYLDDEITDAYALAMAATLFAILPGNFTAEEAIDRATAIIDFEKAVSEQIPSNTDMSEVELYYNLMSYEDTINLAPNVGIDTVIEALSPDEYDYKGAPLITAFPEYLSNLTKVIDVTPGQTLKDFFLWQAVAAFASKVQADELHPYWVFKSSLYGIDPSASPERWEICASHVEDGLGWILGRFYVEQSFSQRAQHFGEDIISKVKAEYVNTFKQADWMDEKTRTVALRKLEKTMVQIGYPKTSPNTTDPSALRDWYVGLDIGDSYFHNYVSLGEFGAAKSWAALSEPTDRYSWGMSPATVNAYNHPLFNKVVFPAAIMQFPVFSADLPSYVSYGAFGSVAGHEISHSFDDSGRKFDEHGAYRNWWSNDTVDEFEKRAQCFVDQFSNYSVPDPAGGKPFPLDGVLTLGEVLADTGGVKVSYAAWDAQRKESPDLSLPGLDYFTHEQLFFIFFGMWYCGEQTPESLVGQVLTDPHPPGHYRIKGTMENSRAFKEAFNCPVKEPVCELW